MIKVIITNYINSGRPIILEETFTKGTVDVVADNIAIARVEIKDLQKAIEVLK